MGLLIRTHSPTQALSKLNCRDLDHAFPYAGETKPHSRRLSTEPSRRSRQTGAYAICRNSTGDGESVAIVPLGRRARRDHCAGNPAPAPVPPGETSIDAVPGADGSEGQRRLAHNLLRTFTLAPEWIGQGTTAPALLAGGSALAWHRTNGHGDARAGWRV